MKHLLFLLFCILLNSCSIIAFVKLNKNYENEEVSNPMFSDQISFKFVKGLIVIGININGENKNFIFDTGATTKIDAKQISQYQCAKIGRIKNTDSNNKTKRHKYINLEQISVGNTVFNNIATSVSNLEKLSRHSNIKIDGIIGANIMKHGIWAIDYKKQIIYFTNNIESLNVEKLNSPINFNSLRNGKPVIMLFHKEKYVGDAIIDTGFNGSFNLNSKYFDSNIASKEKQVKIYAINSEKTSTLKIGEVQLKLGHYFETDTIEVSFSENIKTSFIGNKFLQQYFVIIDWSRNELHLLKRSSTSI
jgi:predicted aspartyl protease